MFNQYLSSFTTRHGGVPRMCFLLFSVVFPDMFLHGNEVSSISPLSSLHSPLTFGSLRWAQNIHLCSPFVEYSWGSPWKASGAILPALPGLVPLWASTGVEFQGFKNQQKTPLQWEEPKGDGRFQMVSGFWRHIKRVVSFSKTCIGNR